MAKMVDKKRFLNAVHLKNGVPTNVTGLSSDDTSFKTVELIKE
jgi:hypothetical protein